LARSYAGLSGGVGSEREIESHSSKGMTNRQVWAIRALLILAAAFLAFIAGLLLADYL
jgi:hypothetical protein